MRRRLLINNGDGMSEGVAYSGTLEVTERTYDDVFFEAPGATHFAIMMNENPATDTGCAFFSGITSDESNINICCSTQNGSSLSIGARKSNIEDKVHPHIVFSESGVVMKSGTGDAESYKRWFQAGKSYDWIAW